MGQLFKKARAAVRFRRITATILRLHALERLLAFLARRGWRARPLATPRGIVIRSTERCFLSCRMCGQNRPGGRLAGVRRSARLEVAPAVLAALAAEIAQWRHKPFVKFTGGEPLLHWRALRPAIERLRAAGCVVKLNTNGVLLKSPAVASEVVGSGLEYLSVSIDGDEATHNRIRGLPTAFASARRGVENVLRARGALRATYPMVLLSCVVSALNQERLAALADVAREWRADWLNIQFLNYFPPRLAAAAAREARGRFGVEAQPWLGFAIEPLARIDPEQVSRGIAEVRRRAPCPVSVMKIGGSGAGAIRRYYLSDEALPRGLCHMPFVTAAVVPPGRLAFCLDYPYYFCGDLEGTTLREAWNGAPAQRFRAGLVDCYRSSGANFPQCRRCNWPGNV